jgi:hypothetical protein
MADFHGHRAAFSIQRVRRDHTPAGLVQWKRYLPGLRYLMCRVNGFFIAAHKLKPLKLD